eukprot:362472-Chlamydomonas_euryale.AAC.5
MPRAPGPDQFDRSCGRRRGARAPAAVQHAPTPCPTPAPIKPHDVLVRPVMGPTAPRRPGPSAASARRARHRRTPSARVRHTDACVRAGRISGATACRGGCVRPDELAERGTRRRSRATGCGRCGAADSVSEPQAGPAGDTATGVLGAQGVHARGAPLSIETMSAGGRQPAGAGIKKVRWENVIGAPGENRKGHARQWYPRRRACWSPKPLPLPVSLRTVATRADPSRAC